MKMKKRDLILSVFALLAFSAGSVLAQATKIEMKPMAMGEMNMSEMQNSPHHKLMMAYRGNAAAFSRTLWEMASDGKIEDIESARTAFGEVKRSMEKMDGIHKAEMAKMAKMDAAMMEKMKPMMEKMQAASSMLKAHMQALEKALGAASPDAQLVAMHTAVLVLKFQKIDMPGKMIEMQAR
jgi:hypothetical protein